MGGDVILDGRQLIKQTRREIPCQRGGWKEQGSNGNGGFHAAVIPSGPAGRNAQPVGFAHTPPSAKNSLPALGGFIFSGDGDMEHNLSWLDRLLIKIALAKAAARGCLDIHLADRLTAGIAGESYMPRPLTAGTTASAAVRRSSEIEESRPIAGQEEDRFPLS